MKLEIRYKDEDFLKEILAVEELAIEDTVSIVNQGDATISRLSTQLSADSLSLLELSISIGSGITANILYAFLKQIWDKGKREVALIQLKSFLGKVRLRSDQPKSEIIEIIQNLITAYQEIKDEIDQSTNTLIFLENDLLVALDTQILSNKDIGLDAEQETKLEHIKSKLLKYPFSRIETLIINDQLEDLLEELLVGSTLQETTNELLLFLYRLRRNEIDFKKGKLTREEYQVEKRVVISFILTWRNDFLK